MEGKVKFFNDQKGYGFLTDIQSGSDYFVHATDCLDKIKKDDLVSFELEEGKKGLKAIKVHRSKVVS
jgi:CspA family cold shock protein